VPARVLEPNFEVGSPSDDPDLPLGARPEA